MNSPKPIRAVERAVDVLRCFGGPASTLTAPEIARKTRLSRAAVYRLLHTLERKGLVRSEGEPQRFQLGHGVVQLASAWLARSDVVAASRPYLTALWERTDETVSLFVPVSERLRVCVQECRSRQPLTFGLGFGDTAPTFVGAAGKAILAFLEPERIERALADATPRERARVLAALAQVRRQGVCVTVGERFLGSVTLAAPVFDHQGAVVASVSLSGPGVRLRGRARQDLVGAVRRTAAEITGALGGQAGALRRKTHTGGRG